MKSDPKYVIKRPVITEESTLQTSAKNKYTFRVDPRATKKQVRDAVEKMFDVHVVSVNTMNYVGKPSRRQARGTTGRRSHWKKAVVTLRHGETIDLI